MPVREIATVVFAVVAAFFYALSNVLEQSEAEQVPDEYSLRPSLFVRLFQRPRWLLGFASDAGGYIAAAAALGFGAVVFVQPILSSGLLISLLLAAAINHHRFHRSDLAAAGMFTLGLAVFLLETSPTGGRDLVPLHRWVIAAPVIGAVVAVLVVSARGFSGAPRAALLGVAGGVCFGASAVLTKGFVHYVRDGVFGWVNHWEPYVMAVVIIGGFLLAQSAFQAGSLAASVAGLEATEPVVSVVFGVGLLDEHVHTRNAIDAAIVGVSAALVVLAILVLARAGARSDAGTVFPAGAGAPPVADPVADPPRTGCAIPDAT
jgi:drug/metabolite transporter (DMT)-like permease